MTNNVVVIPVAILAVVAVCMFIFICWWFPRAWTRGNAMDAAEYDERRRQRELAEETAYESGEGDVELGQGVGNKEGVVATPQVKSTYVPPVTPF